MAHSAAMIDWRRDPLRVASVVVMAVILVLPWPVGRVGNGQVFAGAVVATTRELHTAAWRALSHFGEFRRNVETPGSGEHVLPPRVREALSIFSGEGRGVKRFAVSDGVSASAWDMQQLVASAWPRKVEPGAATRVQLASEPLAPGCSVIDGRTEILLVYCP